VVFNSRCVAAWAGSLVVAAVLLSAIAEIADGFPTAEDIQAKIGSLGLLPAELKSVSLMVWSLPQFSPGNRQHATVYRQVHTGDIPQASQENQLFYAGSGAFHFLDIMTDERHALEQPEAPAGAMVDPAELRLLEVLSGHILRAAQVLHDEMVDNVVHAFRYGGGFEVIWDTEAGLEKLPISQVFWRETTDDIQLVGPIVSQQYAADGTLFIRRFKLRGDDWLQEIFPVGPPHRQVGSEANVRADIRTLSTVHFFMSETGTKVVHAWGPDPIVRVTFDGQTMSLEATPELFKRLENWPTVPGGGGEI
jgi:hypothetical protein